MRVAVAKYMNQIRHHGVDLFVLGDVGCAKSANDIIRKVNRGRAVLNMPPLTRRDQS